jgi:hypothetical protein
MLADPHDGKPLAEKKDHYASSFLTRSEKRAGFARGIVRPNESLGELSILRK